MNNEHGELCVRLGPQIASLIGGEVVAMRDRGVDLGQIMVGIKRAVGAALITLIVLEIERGGESEMANGFVVGIKEHFDATDWDEIRASLKAGERRRCERCDGRGAVKVEFRGIEMPCAVCDGKGSV